ncbi:hypothetical protein [Paraburkholderia phenazinium]|jgi:hypothetical protein|uniref:Uncharacterized protein n=1 Tax=Paraburkholderia phenazinium TaxID=60549 RepID=A0A1G8NT32_9BURK|nr:hypothetical protein [Paraburkholderia phenazinium]SDI83399.1 hypothetical protein SAMN05216466_13718 [Paraburkholderia phenazinium]
MVDLRSARAAGGLTQRTYALQPVRSRSVRIALWAGVAVCGVALGAAGMGWYASQHAILPAQCASLTVSPDGVQAELERTRLALAQESTARAAVQKAADASAAEVSRLNTELLFLRGQSQKRR